MFRRAAAQLQLTSSLGSKTSGTHYSRSGARIKILKKESNFGINLRGPLPQGVIVQGLADDLPAAKAAFKSNWERLLAAGSVKT